MRYYNKKCSIVVHNNCYNNSAQLSSSSQKFTCDYCLYNDSDSKCLLCFKNNGIIKRITLKNIMININYDRFKNYVDIRKYTFIHLNCYYFLKNKEFNPKLIKISSLFKKLPNLIGNNFCIICNNNEGFIIKCGKNNCNKYFHINCALYEYYYIQLKDYNNKRNEIYCMKHTPVNLESEHYKGISNFNYEFNSICKIYNLIDNKNNSKLNKKINKINNKILNNIKKLKRSQLIVLKNIIDNYPIKINSEFIIKIKNNTIKEIIIPNYYILLFKLNKDQININNNDYYNYYAKIYNKITKIN